MISTTVRSDADESAPGKPVILLVDDEPMLRMIVADLLGDAGYSVVEAGNGNEALAALNIDAGIGLMITDFSMSGMNGVELIAAAQSLRPCLPAILLTGYAADPGPTAMVAAARGKYEILPKPIDEPVLMLTIETLLAENAKSAGA